MLRVVIVDDELLGREGIVYLLKSYSNICIAAVLENAQQALDWFAAENADAAFVDIQMPGMDGMSLAAELLGRKPDLRIVFVTAYDKFAVEAFELATLDYLLKPVSADRLKLTLERLAISKQGRVEGVPRENVLIQVLGSFALNVLQANTHGQITKVKFRLNKAKELLAYLIVNHDQAIAKDVLLDALWPDFDLDKASNGLYLATFYLNQTLRDNGIYGSFQAEKGSYILHSDGLNCDYLEFAQYFDGARQPDSNNIDEFSVAAKLYRGSFMAGSDYSWAEAIAREIEANFIFGLHKMADYYFLAREYDKAARFARSILATDNLNEKASETLIKSLAAQGNKAEALHAYKELETVLRKELDIAPSFIYEGLINGHPKQFP